VTRTVVVVADAAAGRRLDAFVAGSGLGISRSQARQLIEAGQVTVGGRVRKPGQLVHTGDEVAVEAPMVAPTTAEPEALPLRVLYEDDAIAVIDKAPGMVVHPAPGRWRGTLVNALLHRWGPMPGQEATRPGIVHRLDRETSGVMVVARTLSALEHLARQFATRTVEKRYLAIVRGRVRGEVIRIDAPIGRHAVERKKMSTRARTARVAVTHIRVLERFAATTFVEAVPETGRTHQIRVHLASRGHPIVGDEVYGRARADERALIGRQALHAASLGIIHPVRGVAMTFHAELWPDMAALTAALRRQPHVHS
jgi:23S rRNA pseudouridine1911/1915/1917 synthase